MLVLSACAPAATATEAPVTQAPTEVITESPTQAPTEAPATEAPTVAPPTNTPPPPPVCDKLADAPAAPAAGELGSTDNPIVITFVPSGDTGKITVAGTAIADCLTQMTGLNFKMEVGTTFAASIEAMGAEKAHVGFLNTFSTLLAEQKYGVVPALVAIRKYATNDLDPDNALGGELQPFYKGQFIANADSGISSFADLKGKIVLLRRPQFHIRLYCSPHHPYGQRHRPGCGFLRHTECRFPPERGDRRLQG